MGKDEHGVFHPGKGKPSGVNKEEGLGIQPTEPEKMEEYLDISDKYTTDPDKLDPSLHIRHPNRNTSKGEDNYKAKENKKESDKTLDLAVAEERSPVVPEELPGILTKELFRELADNKADCCVSVYFGSHESGVEVNEHYDVINFKNKLQEASGKLM